MVVDIRHIDRTCLEEEAFYKLVNKFSSGLTHDIKIIFDLRIKDFGQYTFIDKVHIIRISPIVCGFVKNTTTKLDANAEKYNIISTTIHELYHAQQQEALGNDFWHKDFSQVAEIKNKGKSSFYSICEIETRIYENKNLLRAVEYYDSCCEKQ